MKNSDRKLVRKAALKALAAVPVALLGGFVRRQAAEAAKGSKAQFRYQDLPKHGQRCSACRFYVPSKKPLSRGACKLVAGAISPLGWCIAFTKK